MESTPKYAKPKGWLFILAAALPAAAAALGTVTVVVKTAALKKRPQFYAPTVGSAALGEKLRSSGEQDGWFKVAEGEGYAWIHSSAVTEKKVSYGSASSVGSGGASAEEITLAGKGFNSQVEGSYRSKHPGANFAAVDAMEREKVSEEEALRFLKEGGLGGGGR